MKKTTNLLRLTPPEWSAELSMGSAFATATCGELVQGMLNERDFLINSPIDLYAKSSVILNDSGIVEVEPRSGFSKVEKAVGLTLAICNFSECGAQVRMDSSIPRGKGLASSTAELVAAIKATADACGVTLPEEAITAILLAVDRSTDAVHIDGVTMCNHLEGQVFARFGEPPPLGFLIVDTGGAVETNTFDREKARYVARRHQQELSYAVTLVQKGFRLGLPSLIAKGATISAQVNQEVLWKPQLDELLHGTRQVGALGVNCAHTGTVLGVMFDPRVTTTDVLIDKIKSLVGRSALMGQHKLIGGGSIQERSLSFYNQKMG